MNSIFIFRRKFLHGKENYNRKGLGGVRNVKMSQVLDCDAVNCVYNKDKKCHTLAVNVGDTEPLCDTFMAGPSKGGFEEVIGGIGACKVSGCSFNKSYECTSKGVHMSLVGDHVDCKTYHKK